VTAPFEQAGTVEGVVTSRPNVGDDLDAYLNLNAPDDVARVLGAVAQASLPLVHLIRRGRLAGALDAAIGPAHDGFGQKALDVFADEAFVNGLKGAGVRGVVSEERADPVAIDADGTLLVAIDPLAGSSNIDANISIGTFFAGVSGELERRPRKRVRRKPRQGLAASAGVAGGGLSQADIDLIAERAGTASRAAHIGDNGGVWTIKGATPTASPSGEFSPPTDHHGALLRALVPGERLERGRIVQCDPVFLERHQLLLAQLPQNPIHVNRTEAERVGKGVLIERTVEFVLRSEPDQLQAVEQFQEKVSGALDRAAAADADEVLDDHRLVPRRCPQDRGTQVRKIGEHSLQTCGFYPRHDGVGQSGKGMI